MKLGWLRARVPGVDDTGQRIHECRHCGESVDGKTQSCPTCGRSGIATYVVE